MTVSVLSILYVCLCVCDRTLVAATRSDHHVAVFLQDDIGAVIKIQDGDGMELCGGATWFWNRFGVDEVNLEKKNTKVKTKVFAQIEDNASY